MLSAAEDIIIVNMILKAIQINAKITDFQRLVKLSKASFKYLTILGLNVVAMGLQQKLAGN